MLVVYIFTNIISTFWIEFFMIMYHPPIAHCSFCLQVYFVWYKNSYPAYFWFLLPYNMGFPCGSAGKEFACNVGDLGSIPGLGRFPGEGKGYPLQYSGLENSRDYTVHEVAKSRTWLSDIHIHVYTMYFSIPSLSVCLCPHI